VVSVYPHGSGNFAMSLTSRNHVEEGVMTQHARHTVEIRHLPSERLVKWLPLDDGYYLLASVMTSTRAAPVFVTQKALLQVEAHQVRAVGEHACGILCGAGCVDPATGMEFVLIEDTAPAVRTATINNADAALAADLSRVIAQLERSGRRIMGWYRCDVPLGQLISIQNVGLHRSLFGQPWQVSLFRDGIMGQGRGALVRVEPNEGRAFSIPFVEISAHRRVHGHAPLLTSISWLNYRAESEVALLPDEAFLDGYQFPPEEPVYTASPRRAGLLSGLFPHRPPSVTPRRATPVDPVQTPTAPAAPTPPLSAESVRPAPPVPRRPPSAPVPEPPPVARAPEPPPSAPVPEPPPSAPAPPSASEPIPARDPAVATGHDWPERSIPVFDEGTEPERAEALDELLAELQRRVRVEPPRTVLPSTARSSPRGRRFIMFALGAAAVIIAGFFAIRGIGWSRSGSNSAAAGELDPRLFGGKNATGTTAASRRAGGALTPDQLAQARSALAIMGASTDSLQSHLASLDSALGVARGATGRARACARAKSLGTQARSDSTMISSSQQQLSQLMGPAPMDRVDALFARLKQSRRSLIARCGS
jgi:hypothetical protein